MNCNCNKPASLVYVTKDSPNKGRPYYTCKICKFFQWVNEDTNSNGGNNSNNNANVNKRPAQYSNRSQFSDWKKQKTEQQPEPLTTGSLVPDGVDHEEIKNTKDFALTLLAERMKMDQTIQMKITELQSKMACLQLTQNEIMRLLQNLDERMNDLLNKNSKNDDNPFIGE